MLFVVDLAVALSAISRWNCAATCSVAEVVTCWTSTWLARETSMRRLEVARTKKAMAATVASTTKDRVMTKAMPESLLRRTGERRGPGGREATPGEWSGVGRVLMGAGWSC